MRRPRVYAGIPCGCVGCGIPCLVVMTLLSALFVATVWGLAFG